MSPLDESLAISSELGMRPLMERVVAIQDRVESQRGLRVDGYGGDPASSDGVLSLIVTGSTRCSISWKNTSHALL